MEYVSTKDTAKLIRAAIKEAFPGVKFSVRSDVYSGGSSIRIKWTDGPTERQVESVAGQFAGGYFDGMTDYKGSRYHYLDDKPTKFCCDFVFCDRKTSDEWTQRACDLVYAKYRGNFEADGLKKPTVEEVRSGALWNVEFSGWSDGLQTLVMRMRSKLSTFAAPEPSKTLARLVYAGDDGYGYGSTGMIPKADVVPLRKEA